MHQFAQLPTARMRNCFAKPERKILMKYSLTAIILALGLFPTASVYAEPAAGTIWKEPKTGMEFAWIPTGCFQMGSKAGEHDEQPVHKVCVKGFWMGKSEVTQSQYQQVTGKNPSGFSGVNNPVEEVSWSEANSFAAEMSSATSTKIRLPSEAEWEYACRAGGVHTEFCGSGEDADKLMWHRFNGQKTTHAVGLLKANNWGLFDMNGNVWEWVQDCWNENYAGAPTDGSARETGDCKKRVMRGGAWNFLPTSSRAALRYYDFSTERDKDSGFRVARSAQ
jgi:formylglycine-generating enzyme required for sulfatase activity